VINSYSTFSPVPPNIEVPFLYLCCSESNAPLLSEPVLSTLLSLLYGFVLSIVLSYPRVVLLFAGYLAANASKSFASELSSLYFQLAIDCL